MPVLIKEPACIQAGVLVALVYLQAVSRKSKIRNMAVACRTSAQHNSRPLASHHILYRCALVLCNRKYNHDSLPEGSQLQEGELHWTRRTTILYPLLCSSAGLIAGLFGIGGGTCTGLQCATAISLL